MTDEACEDMEEYQMVMQSLQKLEEGDQQANIKRVEEIVAFILSEIVAAT